MSVKSLTSGKPAGLCKPHIEKHEQYVALRQYNMSTVAERDMETNHKIVQKETSIIFFVDKEDSRGN